jgi:hypothetical protein
MKAYGGVGVHSHVFLTSALVGDEWSTSRHGRFTPEERVPGTHWIGGWLGLSTGPDDVEKRKSLPVTSHYPIALSRLRRTIRE